MRQLPPDLSSKINQSLQTIGNNAQPNMAISVSRAKNTVQDSSYWTVETIREISGLGDVSVAPRRFNVSGRPDRIYEIHVRNGEVFTSIREYPDKLREGFKTQFGLGPGKSVGIAFNGEWKRYRKFYRLVTEEKPWVFWVDDKGDLYARHWDEGQGHWEYPDPTVEVEETDIWDGTYQNNMSVNVSGVLVAFTGCRTTNKIPVVAGQTYIFDNGDNGNYGRLRWVDENNSYIHHQDLGPNAGSAIAPVGAKGVYFFYAWDVTPMPDPRILLQTTTEIPQEPIWIEQLNRKLAKNVVCCKAIRGWKNLVILHQDQGIVVSYIKTNGKVYYRNYCIQEDGSEVWEYEKELTGFTGVAVNINLFITNDYRMGFIVEDNAGKIHWFVTHRNWGGMASPAENINTGVKEIKMEVIPIKYHESYLDSEYISTSVNINRVYVCPANITPEIVNIERLTFVDKKTIQVVFNYILECENNALKESLILTNTVGYRYIIDTITEQDNILTIKTLEEMPTSQNIILFYNDIDSYNIAFRISDTCLYRYDNIIDLVIKGLPPTGYVAENLKVGINPTFISTKVYYKELYSGTENIGTGIVNPTIIVTKVGDNPL